MHLISANIILLSESYLIQICSTIVNTSEGDVVFVARDVDDSRQIFYVYSTRASLLLIMITLPIISKFDYSFDIVLDLKSK